MRLQPEMIEKIRNNWTGAKYFTNSFGHAQAFREMGASMLTIGKNTDVT